MEQKNDNNDKIDQNQNQNVSTSTSTKNDTNKYAWRKSLGEAVVNAQQSVDRNLFTVRAACIITSISCAILAMRYSNTFRRYTSISEIPLWYYSKQKKLYVRLIKQCTTDPSLLYVYHIPLWRRLLLQDTTYSNMKYSSQLLTVRLFGIQLDETSRDYISKEFLYSQQLVTMQLVGYIPYVPEDNNNMNSIATCHINLRQRPFHQDLAIQLVSKGLAECNYESLEKYDTKQHTKLVQRLKQLEKAQEYAQMMQYGIWYNYEAKEFSKRVLSSGKRLTTNGMSKIINIFRKNE